MRTCELDIANVDNAFNSLESLGSDESLSFSLCLYNFTVTDHDDENTM
ncbi:hypothetical protein ACU8KH_01840 [Lachancea thermotolerans]